VLSARRACLAPDHRARSAAAAAVAAAEAETDAADADEASSRVSVVV
jgi:hypothetical protein